MANPEFKRVEALFHQAIALPATERAAFLAQACGGDVALITAVETLLRADSAGETFLASPVADVAAHYRQDPLTLRDPARPGATESPALPALPGYEILEELGRGGMGVVYKARQTALHRIVAVKMLLPTSAVTTEHLARFRIEAAALARLNHPNVVAIHDVGEHQGQPYFIMEYVPGPSLAQVLAGRPQDPRASAHLIETVARAIHAVHECGIIHRDLKPANILMQIADCRLQIDADAKSAICNLQSAIPHVTDFGLAKDRNDDRKLTQAGATLGTPSYMAPEQAANIGAAVGPATDVYALGAILFEMLVGRPPFQADTALATLMAVLHDDPVAPASLRPSLPRDLITICLKCLEKSPRRRYASAWELADDLQRFQSGEPIRARPIGAVETAYRWCRRRPLVAALLALVSTLAVAFVVTVLVYNARLQTALDRLKLQSDQQRRQLVQLNVHVGVTLLDSGDAFTALVHFAEALRLDGDGPDAAEHRGRIAAILERSPRLVELLDLEAPVLGAAVTTTGGLVATVDANHAVAVWDVPTRRRVATGLPHPDRPVRAAFSADGKHLGTITADGSARIWDLATARARRVPAEQPVELLAFHPNGRLLLSEHRGAVVRIWDLTTAELTPVARDLKAAPVFATASADARWLFTADADKHGQLWDVDSGKPVSPAFTLADTVRHATISADGHRIAIVANDRTLGEWDATKGRPIGKTLTLPAGKSTVALSPDGRRLLTCDARGEGRLWDVDTGQSCTPLLHLHGPLVGAGIDIAGERIVTVGSHGIVCFWELRKPGADATARPLAELLAMIQLLADGYLDEQHVLRPLTDAQRRAAWAAIRDGGSRKDAKPPASGSP